MFAVEYLPVKRHVRVLVRMCVFLQLFNEYLSAESRSELQSASEGGTDDEFEKKAVEQLTLWRSVGLNFLKHFLV